LHFEKGVGKLGGFGVLDVEESEERHSGG